MLKHLNLTSKKPNRAVILGAGGFVGSYALQNLIDNKINALGLTRKQINLLEENSEHGLQECLQTDDALVIVSALAPCKSGAMLIDNLQMMQRICNVIEAKQLSHIIYISSDAVYADNVSLANETSVKEPASFHGMMHFARELMIKTAAQKSKTPLAILRCSLLYGVKDPHNGYGPNKFLRTAKKNETIQLFGGGEEKRDHIFIKDVANIINLVLSHKSEGELNIATGVSTSFADIAKLAVKSLDSKSEIQPTERKNPITHRHFDITAINKAFPNFSYTNLEQGINEVCRDI